MKILIINGPNMNLLGLREPDIYGRESYDFLCEKVRAHCEGFGAECTFFQSNHEGAIIDTLQAALGVYDGIIINAAYEHRHCRCASRDSRSRRFGTYERSAITRGLPAYRLRFGCLLCRDLRPRNGRILRGG